MAGNVKPCPKCGGMLSIRLGEWQCSTCDYTESAAKPEEREELTLRPKPKRWKPPVTGTSVANEPPLAQDAGAASTQFLIAYGHPVGDNPEWESLTRPTVDRLLKEKNIYLGVTMGLAAMSIAVVLLADQFLIWLAMVTDNDIFNSSYLRTDIRSVAALILNVIALIILWRILFGPDIWLKWLTIWVVALGLLAMIIPVFGLLLTSEGYQEVTAGRMPLLTALIVLVIAAMVAWYGWLIAILYRDIKQLQV